jgi:DNA-binding HxlR family transcriptional regulator
MRQDGRSGCPINRAVEALGDSWTLLVLRDIVFGGRRHFRELLSGSQEGIASNILADRLRRLVDDGMLTRDDAGRGRRATYSLTESSIALVPVFAALGSWGRQHRETTEELAIRAELLEAGGPAMWEDFMDELREQHLGVPRPHPERPGVRDRLAAARAAVAQQAGTA